MRYIVITGEPGFPTDPCMFEDIRSVAPCDDAKQVEAAINESQSRGGDWTVFELKDGKFEQRSVRFLTDGRTIDGIQ